MTARSVWRWLAALAILAAGWTHPPALTTPAIRG
jgi:hypothetical protein